MVVFPVALLLAVAICGANAGQVVPFTVEKGMEETVVEAVVPLESGDVVCSFSFETTSSENEESSSEGEVSAEEAVAPLFGQCAKKAHDFWAYEVCIGGDVRQLHDAENFLLGRHSRGRGATQEYTDGTPCEAIGGKPGRTTTVHIECGPDMAVTGVQESSPCVYELTVTAPEACRAPSIPKSSSPVSSVAASAEPWVLEGNVLADGSVECEVRFADDLRKSGSTRGGVPMAGFQLRIRDGTAEEGSVQAAQAATFRLESVRVWDGKKTDVGAEKVNVCEDGHGEMFVQNSADGRNLDLQFARIAASVLRT